MTHDGVQSVDGYGFMYLSVGGPQNSEKHLQSNRWYTISRLWWKCNHAEDGKMVAKEWTFNITGVQMTHQNNRFQLPGAFLYESWDDCANQHMRVQNPL